MSLSRKTGETEDCGFIYISASHNPIAHNGIKFGLCGGGILEAKESAVLIDAFNELCAGAELGAAVFLEAPADAVTARLNDVKKDVQFYKNASKAAYEEFTNEVISGEKKGEKQDAVLKSLRNGVAKKSIKIAADFNGSARCVSIDEAYLTALGAGFSAINARTGEIAHRIVPEGESLEPCREFLYSLHSKDPSYILGYTPDCDGDRGNLVVWDDSKKNVRALEAQEVFALAALCELSFDAAKNAGAGGGKAAIVVNDPTSMRVDEIAAFFGVETLRAEVGEANVVSLARKARLEGRAVRFLGEGAAGGVIIHPSAVRDPLDTIGSILKFMCLGEDFCAGAACKDLFELWCKKSSQLSLYTENWTLSSVLASLPRWTTTGAYDAKALLKIKAADHALLKKCYQEIFLREWEAKKKSLYKKYGVKFWRSFRYNGVEEAAAEDFSSAGRGGLKIVFYNESGAPISSIWMRGSGTEPVFRVMADVRGDDAAGEQEMLEWQRVMTREADARALKEA
jgi:phosphoglucomutase